MNSLNANAQSIAERQANQAKPRAQEPAKAGDRVSCLVCSGKGYVFSLRHVVCRECKGTRTVTIEVYK